jgi:hypothetical protein
MKRSRLCFGVVFGDIAARWSSMETVRRSPRSSGQLLHGKAFRFRPPTPTWLIEGVGLARRKVGLGAATPCWQSS